MLSRPIAVLLLSNGLVHQEIAMWGQGCKFWNIDEWKDSLLTSIQKIAQ
jgi:hypothetical protein